ncbi:MAG: 2-hydroxyacid dehydrogenase [Gammaproteobacteria bacterium]|nr:2-hydroxyacid dehydrogenase [Gammaproteobacteria bacterium]
MKPLLLGMLQLFPATQEALEKQYQLIRYWEADDPDALLSSIADQCVGIVTDGGRGVERAVLEKLPNVKIVSVFGVGVDSVDLDYCASNQIPVTNTPDVLSADVADLAIALGLAICRQLVAGDAYTRANRWVTEGPMPLTTRMCEKKAGIFGMGSIGSALAKRLAAFDMDISYCNRSKKPESDYTYYPSLTDMAKAVDFLFVTASATGDSINAVNAEVLDALGPSGYFINVSRGSLVDEPALIEALTHKKIAGAGLDVFAAEPTIPEALINLDNVVLQPHHASGTFETRSAMGNLVIDNLAAHFSSQPLLTPVT